MDIDLRVKQERIEKDLKNLGQFGATPEGGVTRLALTPEEDAAREYVIDIFKDEGMEVTTDDIGNIFARRPGRDSSAAAIMIGSHIDSVINGGIFDGNAGVIAGIEVIRVLNEMGIETEKPLEIAVFFAEESASFGKSCIGSRAFTGQLEKEQMKVLTDRKGVNLEDALRAKGYNPEKLSNVSRDPSTLEAYFEIHIEQADNLVTENIPVGVVTAIAAATRYKVQIKGQAGHSGATPMNRRKDALCAAAEVVLAVEKIAKNQEPGSTVGTVGDLKVEPGAMNIIPGYVELLIDIRDIDSKSKAEAAGKVTEAIKEISQNRNVEVEIIKMADDEPVQTATHLVETLDEAAEKCGIPRKKMHSAAAHDAAYVAAIADVGMLFIRSVGGSHNPDEWADFADVTLATEVLLEAVLKVAG